MQGDRNIYAVANALYGTHEAPRDYNVKTRELLVDKLGMSRGTMVKCVYRKFIEPDSVVYFGHHVDDFMPTGNRDSVTEKLISEFRKLAPTGEPVKNGTRFLGMELERDFDRHIILVRLQEKISEAVEKYLNVIKQRHVPMPTTGWLIHDFEFETLSATKQKLLDVDGIKTYMGIVGVLIWIQGIRHDILVVVLYLTWFNKYPRQHHMDMALYCLGYLNTTKDMPLVLGGTDEFRANISVDTSLGTAPKGRSISAHMTTFGSQSGAVHAKASAQDTVKLASADAEMCGTVPGVQTASRTSNITEDLKFETSGVPRLFSDNEASIGFIKGVNVAKGLRHMQLRQWYLQQEYDQGKFTLEHMKGTIIPIDGGTKIGSKSFHREYCRGIMGLRLLGHDYFAKFENDA